MSHKQELDLEKLENTLYKIVSIMYDTAFLSELQKVLQERYELLKSLDQAHDIKEIEIILGENEDTIPSVVERWAGNKQVWTRCF